MLRLAVARACSVQAGFRITRTQWRCNANAQLAYHEELETDLSESTLLLLQSAEIADSDDELSFGSSTTANTQSAPSKPLLKQKERESNEILDSLSIDKSLRKPLSLEADYLATIGDENIEDDLKRECAKTIASDLAAQRLTDKKAREKEVDQLEERLKPLFDSIKARIPEYTEKELENNQEKRYFAAIRHEITDIGRSYNATPREQWELESANLTQFEEIMTLAGSKVLELLPTTVHTYNSPKPQPPQDALNRFSLQLSKKDLFSNENDPNSFDHLKNIVSHVHNNPFHQEDPLKTHDQALRRYADHQTKFSNIQRDQLNEQADYQQDNEIMEPLIESFDIQSEKLAETKQVEKVFRFFYKNIHILIGGARDLCPDAKEIVTKSYTGVKSLVYETDPEDEFSTFIKDGFDHDWHHYFEDKEEGADPETQYTPHHEHDRRRRQNMDELKGVYDIGYTDDIPVTLGYEQLHNPRCTPPNTPEVMHREIILKLAQLVSQIDLSHVLEYKTRKRDEEELYLESEADDDHFFEDDAVIQQDNEYELGRLRWKSAINMCKMMVHVYPTHFLTWHAMKRVSTFSPYWPRFMPGLDHIEQMTGECFDRYSPIRTDKFFNNFISHVGEPFHYPEPEAVEPTILHEEHYPQPKYDTNIQMDPAKRLTKLDYAIKTGQNVALNHIKYGQLYLAAGHIDYAIRTYINGMADGNVDCMFKLSLCFYLGLGVVQSKVTSFSLLREAAYRKHPEAMNNYATLRQFQYPIDSFYMYREAAELGSIDAMCNMAVCYIFGLGCRRKLDVGMKILQYCVNYEHPPAYFVMGNVYKAGGVVDQDHHTAVRYFRKAANFGFPDAQYEFAMCLLEGRGIGKDINEAVKYLKLARTRLSHAQGYLEFLVDEGVLTADQIA